MSTVVVDGDQRTQHWTWRNASYSEVSMYEIATSTHHQPRLNGRVAGPDGGPVGWMDASYLEVHVQSIERSGCALLECWSCRNDQMGTGIRSNFRLRFLCFLGTLLTLALSICPSLSRASGGFFGGGRLDRRGRRRIHDEQRGGQTEDRKRRQEANGSPVFLACWFLRLHVRIFLLPGAFLQPLYSCLSHCSQSLTHFHSQLGIPIKTKSLHIFRAGTRPLCKSGPLMTPPTTLMVWAGSPPGLAQLA